MTVSNFGAVALFEFRFAIEARKIAESGRRLK